MNIAKNKLWVSPATDAALKMAEAHPHSYACDDHCLFISPMGPKGTVEVTEELAPYLTTEDWRWLYRESEHIRREQEEQYHKEMIAAQKSFFARFEADLKSALAEGINGEPEENEARAGSAEN